MPDAMGFPNQQFFRPADPPQVPEPIRNLADEACAPFNECLPHRRLQGTLIPGVPRLRTDASGLHASGVTFDQR